MTLLTYGILIGRGRPSDLGIPQLTPEQLVNGTAQLPYPVCGDCAPSLDGILYAANMPQQLNQTNLPKALSDGWTNSNPGLGQFKVDAVQIPNNDDNNHYEAVTDGYVASLACFFRQ